MLDLSRFSKKYFYFYEVSKAVRQHRLPSFFSFYTEEHWPEKIKAKASSKLLI